MDPDATGRRVIWPRVPVCNFLFVNPGQSIRIVIVRIGVEFPKKRRNMVVEFRKAGFPSERHNDMLVYKRCICDNPGFLVFALIKRNGQRFNFFLHNLLVL